MSTRKHVNVILRQADDPVDENEADIDLWIEAEELGEDRDEMQASSHAHEVAALIEKAAATAN